MELADELDGMMEYKYRVRESKVNGYEAIYNDKFDKPNNKIDLFEERNILLNQMQFNKFILEYNN